MTTCSRQSVQVHPSKEGRLFHYRQVHRCPVRTYEGRSYPVFLQMASLFPASGKFFVPALRPCRARRPGRAQDRPAHDLRRANIANQRGPGKRRGISSVKESPGQRGNQGSGCEGGRRVHALRSWRKLIQPVRHVSTMAHARARGKHRQTRRTRHGPLFCATPPLAGKRQRGPRDRISFRAMIFSACPPCSERHRPVPVPPGLPPNSSSSRAQPDVVLKKRATMRFQPIPF